MIDGHWVDAAVAAASETGRGDLHDVGRLRGQLLAWAEGFAASRADVGSALLTWPRRGLEPDEATSFLTAVDDGQVRVDAAGYFTLPSVRPKAPPGRYALLSRSGAGASVNLEYLIQAGATGELVRVHGWRADALDFERGEFDALGHGLDDRVVLAVEAKCRVSGSDSLSKLLQAWLAVDAAHPPLLDNAGRKYRELVRLCGAGPVVVWLVAACARWTFLATLADGLVHIEPHPDPSWRRAQTLSGSSGRRVLHVQRYDAAMHAAGSSGAIGRCSWMCSHPPSFTVRVREVGGTESTFALCDTHLSRVRAVYEA